MTFDDLLAEVKKEEFVFIQTHNYPDHDAVASAFGLQYLLSELGVSSRIIYEGEIQRDSLIQMIDELEIDIQHCEYHRMTESHKIIIVDGKGNHLETTNRTRLPTFEKSKKARLLDYELFNADMPLTNPVDAQDEIEAAFIKSKFTK